MCGVTGAVLPRDSSSAFHLTSLLAAAEKAQAHRGPDGSDTAMRPVDAWDVGLGHQRLAILDLTPSGTQPLAGPCGEGLLSFNGEVYNYVELRQQLRAEGVPFRGTSDSEVMAAALHTWGVDRALESFNGMWAFAWLDQRRRRLVLARDRVGIKPLYLRLDPSHLYFASEIKGLLAMSHDRFSVNRAVSHAFLAQSLLDTSRESMFQGIVSLEPGCYLEVDLGSKTLEYRTVRYWSPPLEADPTTSEEALFEEVRSLFHDAVRLRLRSDVPVGVLLSGGIDSTAIACAVESAPRASGASNEVAMLAAVSADPRFDESPFIDTVAAFLNRGVHKVSFDLDPAEALRLAAHATWHNDEPIGSFTSVAHYRLMEAAKELGATVILSGQGADELLCGYKKYVGFYGQSLLRQGRFIPAARIAFDTLRQGTLLPQLTLTEARRYLPHWSDRRASLLGPALEDIPYIPVGLAAGMSMQARQALDLQSLSVPQYTHYEDRMSMAFGREVRLPFLDVRLIERLLPLEANHKLRHGWTKYVFRKALEPDIPKQITWRRDKQGFTLPQSAWLHGPLRQPVLDLFEPDALIFKHGLLDRSRLLDAYKRFYDAPLGRSGVWYREIFNPLALELWLRAFQPYLSEGA